MMQQPLAHSSETLTFSADSQREFRARVVATTPEMGNCTLLTLAVPAGLAHRLRPGQFVNVLCRDALSLDPLLRRPYSFFRVDPSGNTMTLLIRPFGRGSQWLAGRTVGETLDVMGPLGNGFQVSDRSDRLLMVAGGVGIAPLVHLSDEALARGQSVTLLMGASTATTLLSAAELPAEVEYVVATDDGSQGHAGFVTDLVPDYLPWADQVLACGPDPMLRSLANVVRQHRLGRRPSVQVSVERSMACGVGACLGCVIDTRHGMQTSCVTGPVFPIEEIVW
jgi:dihydroorotate dehydrogenase electron transfer subunit